MQSNVFCEVDTEFLNIIFLCLIDYTCYTVTFSCLIVEPPPPQKKSLAAGKWLGWPIVW